MSTSTCSGETCWNSTTPIMNIFNLFFGILVIGTNVIQDTPVVLDSSFTFNEQGITTSKILSLRYDKMANLCQTCMV